MLLMIGCWLSISAQEEPPKIKALSVGDELVKPSMVSEYEAAIKEYMALCAESEYKYPIYAYSTRDFHYYYVTPIEFKYSELDSIRKYGKKNYSANPEKWDAVWEKFEGTYEYYIPKLIVQNEELSYKPENPRLNSEERMFYYWMFCYVLPTKTSEFKDVLKKWKELYKNKNISDGFNVYWGAMGVEQPLYIVIMSGKDNADFWNQASLRRETLGEEAKQLWKEGGKLLRKYETKEGWYRPDLSYILEEK